MPIIESVMGIQVIGNNGENIIKSPIVEAYIGSSLLDSTEVASDIPTDISTKVEQLMAVKHTHSNKAVLDKFAETNGKPTYNGIAIGGGGSGGASTAEDVSYTNTQLPNVENVKAALDELVPKSHTHATGSNITLADNTEYRLTDVTTLSLSYPTSKFECWMRLTFAASGNITVTLPADTEYLGATPNFKNGETWELSFKDKILAAKKVGDDDKDAGGENGITPHIGENGNWYIGNTDTGKPSRGKDGKSAYQYAQEGGYTGTETEFAEKLAQEQLSGTTNNLTPTQVYEAVSAGIPVKVQYLDSTYGLLSFTAFNVAESFNLIVSQTIVYANGVYILVELSGDKALNSWKLMFTTLVQETDIPTELPNPNAITFTGAVTGHYDGSAEMTVVIPYAVTDDHINSLIDTKLGVIENGSY